MKKIIAISLSICLLACTTVSATTATNTRNISTRCASGGAAAGPNDQLPPIP